MKNFEEQTNVSFPPEMKYIYYKPSNFWDATTQEKQKITRYPTYNINV